MMRNLFKISLLSLFISPFLVSQELTSDITGTVSSSTGSVSGAQVEITYEPTNTSITRTTDESGRYFAGGLRPGGPYTITVSAAGLVSQNATTTLVVGDTRRLSFSMASADLVDELIVTGSRVTADRDGFTTLIDAETIATTPSVTRDIKDILKLNPFVTLDDEEDGEESISIGGAHPRTNDLRVDGVSFNDDFGLNSNGYPSQRSPINFGSIEQLAVKVAPASVEYAQFRGGVIDIITKGGTNEFTGDFAYFDRGDSLMGDKLEGEDIDITKDDTAYELAFGGPIIKDELFFYVTYSESEIANPLRYGIQGSGAENILDVTADQAEQVRSAVQSLIGKDPFGPTGATESSQENLTLRLDWTINEKHRLTFNHKDIFGNDLRGSSSSRNRVALYSSRYIKDEETTTNSLHLVSDLSDNLISEVYISTKETATDQVSPAGQNMPNIVVEDAFGYEFVAGPDIFRMANDLDTETNFFKAKLTYYQNNHKITAGFENTVYDTYNLFIINEDGSFEFDDLAALQAGQIGSYSAAGAKTGDVNDAAAIFEYELSSLYLMDEFTMSDSLTLTFGIRYDDYSGDDTPTNQSFIDEYGFKNGGIKGTDLFTYRFGADFVLDDLSDLNITYGTYSAKLPNVWISNAYSNTGVNVANYLSEYGGCPQTDLYSDFSFTGSNSKPDCVIASISDPNNVSGKVDFIAPSFEWPKSNILNVTYNRVLPNDIDMTLTFLKSKEEEALYRIVDTGYPLIGDEPTVPTQKAPDGRPIYNQTGVYGYRAGLYNVCCGDREVFTASLSKAFRDGDTFVTLAYTAQDHQNRSDMTSSTSNSNFGKTGAIDFNNRIKNRSTYETEHSILMTLTSKHYFFGGNAPTTFSLVFSRESGNVKYPTFDTYTSRVSDYQARAFGYEFNLNDDSSSLLYIPTANDPIVCYSYECTDEGSADALEREAEVLDFLYNVWGLQGYAGEIAPRDAGNFPWQSSLDLNIVQEIPGFREGDSFVLTFALENLLNFIDDDKGIIRYGYYSGRVPVIDLKIIDNERYDYSRNAFRYSFDDPFNIDRSTTQSLWRASLGIQYKF
jgi:hypothetical protein